MSKVVKWIVIILGGIIGLIVLAIALIYLMSSLGANKTYTIQADTLTVPTDAATIERGQHLAVAINKCVDCHTPNFGGGIVIDDPGLGRVVATNLTTGKGGVGGTLSDADWARAIRHGVKPDGKPIMIMPSEDYAYLSDTDLADLIAFLKSVDPVDNEVPASAMGPLGRVLYVTGQLPLFQAELIDHTAPRPPAPEPGVSVEYGKYLANIGGCTGCHGPGLSGGHVPGTPPDDPKFPPAANITPGGKHVATWSEADFIKTMRTGRRPDGSQLDPFMPWPYVAQMTDDELKAVWIFLQSVPAKPDGNR